MGTRTFSSNEKTMVRGTRTAGSNITEPSPRSSRYLETQHGGFAVVGEKVGPYLQVKVRESPAKPLFIRIHYQTADKNRSLTNTAPFLPRSGGFIFSSPEHIPGIRIYRDYLIRVEIFESSDSSQPVDTLIQPVRSYVDTTGDTVKLFNNVRQG
jgi:hypothetical protein